VTTPQRVNPELLEGGISKLWLEQHFELTNHVRRQHSSYKCKLFAENWADCRIGNGALIAAAAIVDDLFPKFKQQASLRVDQLLIRADQAEAPW